MKSQLTKKQVQKIQDLYNTAELKYHMVQSIRLVLKDNKNDLESLHYFQELTNKLFFQELMRKNGELE
jgi:hypothetical protein